MKKRKKIEKQSLWDFVFNNCPGVLLGCSPDEETGEATITVDYGVVVQAVDYFRKFSFLEIVGTHNRVEGLVFYLKFGK